MQFIVIAYDGTDEQAPERRQAAREKHLSNIAKLKKNGELLYAAAMLSEQQQMIGSTLICEFESRKALDRWLESEPYVVGKVWKDIKVLPCKVPESFLNSQ